MSAHFLPGLIADRLSIGGGGIAASSEFKALPPAERYADRVAVKAGFATRLASAWMLEQQLRTLTYKSNHKAMELTVKISRADAGESAGAWLLASQIKRTDLGLCAESKPRARPGFFAKDVSDLVARLYRVPVDRNGRLIGQLTAWSRETGLGSLECVHGVCAHFNPGHAYLSEHHRIRRGDWFSFDISADDRGQIAINIWPLITTR